MAITLATIDKVSMVVVKKIMGMNYESKKIKCGGDGGEDDDDDDGDNDESVGDIDYKYNMAEDVWFNLK